MSTIKKVAQAMPNSSEIIKIASAISTIILVGLASYLVVRGMAIPDWLTLLIGGAGGGGLVGIGHTIGVTTTQTAANTLQPTSANGQHTNGGTNG